MSASQSRAADDLEHVGGRGLLLQRFAQLVEQARVLDSDDGLLCEMAHKLDLLVGEWSDFLAVDENRADQIVLLEHRHGEVRSCAGKFGWRAGNGGFSIVRRMKHFLRFPYAIESPIRLGQKPSTPVEKIGERRRRVH